MKVAIVKGKESHQMVAGLIESIEPRWLNYEEDRVYSLCTLLDPRFREICFTNALIRAKRLCQLCMQLHKETYVYSYLQAVQVWRECTL